MRDDDIDAATEGLISAGFTNEQVMEIVEGLAEEEWAPPTGHRLRDTGNGPTVSYEEALLRECFGEPDEEGVYR